MATDQMDQGSDAAAAFAAAAGIDAGDVRDLRVIPGPPSGDIQSLLLARSSAEDGTTGALVLVRRCPGAGPGACPPEVLVIPDADALEPLAVLDLNVARQTLPLAEDASVAADLAVGAGAASPALLLRVRRDWGGGDWQHEAVLCSLDGPPRLLWRAPTHAEGAGGGFTTFGAELVRSAAVGGRPDIVLHQTTLPGPGEEPFMPGPPLTLRYVYDGEVYRQVE
jgi:hypothetical protein